MIFSHLNITCLGLPRWLSGKRICLAVEEDSGEGSGHPPQYSCLENPTDRGAWWAPWGGKESGMIEHVHKDVVILREERRCSLAMGIYPTRCLRVSWVSALVSDVNLGETPSYLCLRYLFCCFRSFFSSGIPLTPWHTFSGSPTAAGHSTLVFKLFSVFSNCAFWFMSVLLIYPPAWRRLFSAMSSLLGHRLKTVFLSVAAFSISSISFNS